MDKLTTSANIPTGKKIELTPEQKKKQKERDEKLLETYDVQIDQFSLEILKLEKAIELNLPLREYKSQITEIKEKMNQFERLKKVIEERNK